MQTAENQDHEVQAVDDKGMPVRRRLASYEAARSLFTKLKDEDGQGDAKRRAKLQNMINGNPPYNPKDLKSKGLSHMCNVNFMAMRSNLDERAAAAHELFVEVPTLVELKPKSTLQQNPEVYHWCSVVSEEFSEMVMDWDGFLPAMDQAVRESDAFGVGFVLFPDRWDWRFVPGRRSRLLTSPRARVELDSNDIILVRDEMSVGEVCKKIADEETAAKAGWDIHNTRTLLTAIFRKGTKAGETTYQASTWESFAHMIRNNDPYYQQKEIEMVRIVHLFIKEVDGEQKVSHYIMPEGNDCQGYLFEEHDAYDRMSEALWWLPYNYGDGYFRSVRGVASLMAPHDDLSNRFLNSVFDLGFLSSKLILQPRNPGDLGKLAFTTFGQYAVLPHNLEAIQTSFRPQIGPLIELRNVSEKVMQNNTGLYKRHNESFEREAQKTARQVMEETSKEARYEKAAVAHRYTLLDKLYREVFRRVFAAMEASGDISYPGYESARAFFKRCEDRGVERKFLKEILEKVRVSATRALGLGSPGVKFDITNQLLNASNMMDEAGKREALRSWVAARVGYRNADKYALRVDRDTVASDATSLSILEWNDITEGHQVIVGSDQLHKAHVLVFMQKIAELIQMHEQQQIEDYMQAFRTMQLALQHIGEHTQHMAQDPRYQDFVKQVQEFFKVAQQALQAFEQLAKRQMQMMQQQQAAQQQQLADADQIKRDREIELKIFEAQQRFELDRMTKDSMNKMRELKANEQIATKRNQTAANMQLQAEKQAVELELARQKADTERQIKMSRV